MTHSKPSSFQALSVHFFLFFHGYENLHISNPKEPLTWEAFRRSNQQLFKKVFICSKNPLKNFQFNAIFGYFGGYEKPVSRNETSIYVEHSLGQKRNSKSIEITRNRMILIMLMYQWLQW